MESEFVLEFVVHHITCRNASAQRSPLVITVPACPSLTLNPRSATIGKVAYERGKRIIFGHSHLLDLKTSFILVQGHGDHTARASCEIDFFALASVGDRRVPAVYDVEVGMQRPAGDHFGLLNVSFQIMPLGEFTEILAKPVTAPRSPVRTSDSKPSAKRISVVKQDSPRSARAGPCVPEIPLSPPLSSRSGAASIHERYMKRNELWIGNHCSTHTDSEVRTSSRGSVESGSPRKSRSWDSSFRCAFKILSVQDNE